MQTHSQIGADILKGDESTLLTTAREICLSHHEKWDGTGYPNGLKAEEIPEAARIVAIVDVYDALVHKRVYKAAFPEAEALAIMDEMAINHLDPSLYRLFISIIDKIREIKDQNQDDEI